MIQIEVGVACGVDEVAWLVARHLCHHLEQQGVGGDVEGYAEEGVGRALVELERQTVASHIKLEDGVTRGQGHLVYLGHVPGRDNHPAGVGVVLQLVEHVLNLVDGAAVVVGPRTPLVTIDGTQFAVLIGPLVPDAYAVLLKVFHVGVALEEPEQFVDDRFQVEFLRGQQGKPVVEVVARLGAEDANGACARTVTFLGAFGQDAIEDV